ncbi:hypothetical protein GCM10017771_64670 [Streptomyces capitiformicae]|uniref:Uncharacterized protein n=1 Tax=Streptomyces capitiformicae TaxID=2014920 RepID=A0A918ZBM6_9ACTN|nr:hypothetical protein GCM10017771_64670 [Streptomyces capitiformicae]
MNQGPRRFFLSLPDGTGVTITLGSFLQLCPRARQESAGGWIGGMGEWPLRDRRPDTGVKPAPAHGGARQTSADRIPRDSTALCCGRRDGFPSASC